MNQNKKPILSISLLVSNGQIETIRKTMDSLQSLRNAVPNELIIVDTGCTDGSIEICREYADQIIPFTWCNDFSAARNTGLKACSGEWFLYFDDDEWFEDTKEIEEFFLSGDYKNYDSGWYIVRNYDNYEGTRFSEGFVGRMCQITPETTFHGKIHEWLEPFAVKIKDFSCYAHHYGYVFNSEEEKQKHLQRNLVLEEEAIRKNPKDVRMCCQLIQEYRAAERYQDAENLTKKVLRETKEGINGSFVQYLVTCLPRIKAESGRLEEAYEEYNKLLNNHLLNNFAINLCLYERALIQILLHNDTKFLEDITDYLKHVTTFEVQNGEFPIMDFASYYTPAKINHAVEMSIMAMLRSHDLSKTEYLFSVFDWLDKSIEQKEMILLFFQCYAETKNSSLFRKIAPRILLQEENKKYFFHGIEDFIPRYPDQYESFLADIESLHRTDEYFGYLHICYCIGHQINVEDALKTYFQGGDRKHDEEVTAILLPYPKLFWYLKDVSVENLTKGLLLGLTGKKEDEINTILRNEIITTEKSKEAFTFPHNYLIMKMNEILLSMIDDTNHEKMKKSFEAYMESVKAYLESQYAVEGYSIDKAEVYPDECEAAFLLQEVSTADMKSVFFRQQAKLIANKYPQMISVLQSILNERKKSIAATEKQSVSSELRSESSELLQLANQMKEIILSKIDQGRNKEAQELLNEVEKLVPQEAWIQELKKRITE